jgi:glycosyltransferase involved in cell wall biosynthesis
LCPENTVFVILSFEGPDQYSLAGGLGVRVSNLSEALAGLGYETHIFFVGDPYLEGITSLHHNRLILHRWCQWISKYHPYGVYDGEEGKLQDFTASIPDYVLQSLIYPALRTGKRVVVLAEEWHTAEALCHLNDSLSQHGLLDKAILVWNANNTYSFHRIDWSRLKKRAMLTTVSRYMRHTMKPLGFEPLVINNGIQTKLVQPVDPQKQKDFTMGLDADFVLFKMARFDPAKGWMSAIETAGRLKNMGYQVLFFLRGGIETYGHEVLKQAGNLGLSIADVHLNGHGLDHSLRELTAAARSADIVNITSFISHDLARIMFASSHAVLANSSHEPFGLVGLEAMAAGGTAFVGMTGEDYAHHLKDSVVLETDKTQEALNAMLYLHANMELKWSMKNQARITAQNFTWDQIIEHQLLPKLEWLNMIQDTSHSIL